MKKAMAMALAFVALSGCDRGPWEGPAGTKIGIKADALGKLVILEKISSSQKGVTLFRSRQAPKIVQGATDYQYTFSGEGSLCLVQVFISKVRGSNSQLVDELAKKYGMPVKDPSVAWGVEWSSSAYKLDSSLARIGIEFVGVDPSPDAIVNFEYQNYDQCSS